MAKTYLLKKDGRYYARLTVPARLQAILGKKELRTNLRTSDAKIADKRKHKALADLHARIAAARIKAGDDTDMDLLEGFSVAPQDDRNPYIERNRERRKQGDKQDAIIADNKKHLFHADWAYDEETGEFVTDDDEPDKIIAAIEEAENPTTLIADSIDSFLASYSNRAPHTQTTRHKDILKLIEWLKLIDVPPHVERITTALAYRYKQHLILKTDSKRGTVNKSIGSLQQYWKHLGNIGVATGNPWRGQFWSKIESGEEEQTPIDPYSNAQLATLIDKAPADMRPAITLAALTGARRGELFRVKVSDLLDGLIRLPGTKTRASLRAVPLHPIASAVASELAKGKGPDDYLLEDRRDGSRGKVKAGDAFGKRFTRYKNSLASESAFAGADMTRLDFHSLRKWFATTLEEAGVALSTVEILLGHKRKGTAATFYVDPMKVIRNKETLAAVDKGDRNKLREFLRPTIDRLTLPEMAQESAVDIGQPI